MSTPRTIPFLALAIALTASAARSAARCDLAMNNQPGACLDPKALAGKTIKVPSNITRIGEEGLALCTPTYVQSLSSDIVYIVDNSASMSATSFWVNPSTKDTAFYIQDCLQDMDEAEGTWVHLRLRHFGGTSGKDSLGIDSLFRLNSRPTSCDESNDPYNMRAQAVRVALDYQAAFDSNSMAGVLYFNSQVRQKYQMRGLGSKALKALVDSVGFYKASSGTKWAAPFDTAFRWLDKINTGRNEAIILVSDGEPTDKTYYLPLLGKDGQPPIYAIYLGQSTDPTPQLDTVVALTFGKKFVVPPDRPDSLEGVIKSIVASVTRKDAPSASVIANTTNGQTSRTVAIQGDAYDAWSLQLDSAIGLVSGANQIVSVTTWKTTSGTVKDTSAFVIDVSGPATPMGETPIAGTPLSAVCTEASTLSFTDSKWSPIASVVEGGGPVGVVLHPSGTPTLPLRLSVTSGAGDLEKLALSTLDSIAPANWGRAMPLSIARLAPAAPGNLTIEARSGYDTLRTSWCHPRDARDCAEASLQVVAVREAALRWIPRSVPGSSGSLVLEAVLPGQAGKSVQVPIYRHGVRIANGTLVRVQDSLFRDTVYFLQGGRRPGTDTLWLNAPSALVPDSLIATLVWGLDNSTLADTATIVRPPLSLALDWTGTADDVAISLAGGQVDARGERAVRLWASSRSQQVVLDSSAHAVADVTVLARTGKGQTWIKGIFVDPVYGDTAVDSVLVPAPASSLQFEPQTLEGPTGSFALSAQIPGATGASIKVVIWRRERAIATVTLARLPDSSFSGDVRFRQGPVRPLGDTLWMNLPPLGASDTLSATYVDPLSGDTLSDTAFVTRPAFRLSAQSSGGTSIALRLVGGQPDARGNRFGTIQVVAAQQAVFDSLGASTVDVLDQLSKVSGTSATVRAWYVDPVYGDTARDSVTISVPGRSVRFQPSQVEGPRASFTIEATDPWARGNTLDVVVAHGRDSSVVRLSRLDGGAFKATLPFSQAASALGDTLVLGRPASVTDSVFVVLPRRDSLPVLVDRAVVRRPRLALVLSARSSAPQHVLISVTGGSADARGEAWVRLKGPVTIPSEKLTKSGDLAWDGTSELDTILPESPDSVVVEGAFVDPIYGDTAFATLRIASPWFPSSIVVSPAKADPRVGDTVRVLVRDKDAHPDKVDTVVVKVGTVVLRLVETDRNTGEYVLRIGVEKIDPRWADHPTREPWKVELVHVDPDHPRDVSSTWLVLEYNVPPPEVTVHAPLVSSTTESRYGKPHLEIVSPDSKGEYPSKAQGVEFKIWEHTRVAAFVYDKIGTAVASWEGELDNATPEKAARFLLEWDGCDRDGRMTAPGIYLIRVVLVADDGLPLGNIVFTVGRKKKD